MRQQFICITTHPDYNMPLSNLLVLIKRFSFIAFCYLICLYHRHRALVTFSSFMLTQHSYCNPHVLLSCCSRLPWFDVFYKLLNKISDIMMGGDSQLQLLLEAVYNTKVPLPNEPCTILPGSPLVSSNGLSSQCLKGGCRHAASLHVKKIIHSPLC